MKRFGRVLGGLAAVSALIAVIALSDRSGQAQTGPTGGNAFNTFYGTIKGDNVASTTTISPTGGIFHITGTTTVNTIQLPFTGFTGQITIIPDAATPFTSTGGNIGLATTATANKALIETFDGNKWYPSY